MRLDAGVLRYLTRDDFRVLTAIEMGMKNHELVPTTLICSIAALAAGPGAAFKIINTLHRNKLIYHEAKTYDGYRLTYLGYDYLALRTYVARGLISGLGRRIGVGKEADIYECINEAGEMMVLKIHRLGRISFRQIKNKRDYLLHRRNASWMYMSRLAAIREFTFLKALYDHGFPVPVPYDQSRHTILMSHVNATPFGQIRGVSNVAKVYSELLNLIVRLAQHGLIHCDFNEFNLLMDDDEKITLIDFPQMVSSSHAEAADFFARDVGCVTRYFSKRFHLSVGEFPSLADVDVTTKIDLDKELAASGHNVLPDENQRREFEKMIQGRVDGAKLRHEMDLLAEGGGDHGEDGEAEDGEDEEEGEDDEEDLDEESLAESLGVDSSDLAPAASSSATSAKNLDDNGAEARLLAAQLEGDLAQDEERPRGAASKAGSSGKAGKSKKASAAATAAPAASAEDEEEEAEANSEDDAAAEEEARRERMARKDARQAAHASSQAQKAARKAAEKERQRRVREGLPPLEAKPAAAALAAKPATAVASESEQHKDAAAAENDDDDQNALSDGESVASSAGAYNNAALAHLRLGAGSGQGVLNIQLPKPEIRVKRANKNKDRERKKLHATIKEHL